MRGAKRVAAVVTLTAGLIVTAPAAAVACPFDDDCGYEPVGPVGPVGPDAFGNPIELRSDAFKAPGANVWIYTDGSSTDTYDPHHMDPPTFMDQLQRAWESIERLFDFPDKYEPNPNSGSGIRG